MIVACDCGRSSFKFGTAGKFFAEKSLQREIDLSLFLTATPLSKNTPLIVRYKGKVHLVGEFCQNYKNSEVSFEDDSFIKESLLYYLIAVGLMNPSHDPVVLGINLTYNTFRYKDFLRSNLVGYHSIEIYDWTSQKFVQKAFSISKVGVVYQGWSALVDVCLTKNKTLKDEYKNLSSQQGLILDIGRWTLDVIQATRLVPTDGATFHLGTFTVYNHVSLVLREQHSLTKPSYEIEQRHINAWPIQPLSGPEIDVVSLVRRGAKTQCSRIVSALKEWFFDATPDYIYLVGGGARLFEEHLKKTFPRVSSFDRPELLNVKGLWKFFGEAE